MRGGSAVVSKGLESMSVAHLQMLWCGGAMTQPGGLLTRMNLPVSAWVCLFSLGRSEASGILVSERRMILQRVCTSSKYP